jgi:23S rRNA (uracil1939-C5)-methyltransferase
LKKGDLLELNIEGYAFEGKGISKINREVPSKEGIVSKKFVIFVDGSYPGDRVTALITKIRSSYAEAKVKELIVKSPIRTEPVCKYFGICGGCKSQNLQYEHQIAFKESQVRELFERIGGFSGFEILPIISSEKTYFYRSKMEYSFSDKRWLTIEEISSGGEVPDRDFALGLHIPGMFDKVLDIDGCWLQSELSNDILTFTKKFFVDRKISAHSIKEHTGMLRNLVIKQSFRTGDLMVNLVVNEENEQLFSSYKESLCERFPQITTLVYNINRKLSQVAYGDYEIVAFGPGYIYDMIGDYKFRVSANSFFQTNSAQAENLYSIALNFADINGTETVYDLYSGAGTIPIFISEKVKRVYGFESALPAIEDAEKNIELNSISNFVPLIADLNKSLIPLVESKNLPAPDVVIADPPRSGMNPKTVADLLELSPEKIVYISCNPATQARDVKLLCAEKYRLVKLQPVDMFPHTYHIENVALLVKY